MNAVNALPTSAQMMPAGNAADERRAKLHLGVGDEAVHDREHDGDDQRTAGSAARLGMSMRAAQTHRPTLQTGCSAALASSPNATASRMGPMNHHAQIFDEAARETSRVLDTPHEIETGFDLLNGGDHGVDEKSQPDRAEENAAHVGDELHDAFGQFRCRAAQRAEEFIQQESQISVRAPAFQNRKTEDHQRYDRKQRRVSQAHCAHADFAVQPIADQRRRIARQAQHRAPRRTQGRASR